MNKKITIKKSDLKRLVEELINEEADARVKWKDLKPKGKVLRVLSVGIAPLKKKGVKWIKGEKLAKYYASQVGSPDLDADSLKAIDLISQQMGGSDSDSLVMIPGDPKYAYVIQKDNTKAKAIIKASGKITGAFNIPKGSALAHAAGLHKGDSDGKLKDYTKEQGSANLYTPVEVTKPLVKHIEEMIEQEDPKPKTSALNLARMVAFANGRNPKNVKKGEELNFPVAFGEISRWKSWDDFYSEMIKLAGNDEK
jgi:hypothetical protein